MLAGIIKVCGITRLADAVAAVEAGANALGFNFHPGSSRRVEPEHAARILRELPAAVVKVGIFVNQPAERVARLAASIGLDVAQLHGEETASPLLSEIRVWKAFAGTRPDLAQALETFPAEAYVIDAPTPQWGGSGETFDWTVIEAVRRPGLRLILAGGLGPENVAQAIRTVRPWGVDACSRLESEPGVKDHEKVRRFVAAARAEMGL